MKAKAMKARHAVLGTVLLVGTIHVWAGQADQATLANITKPTTTILIMFLLFGAGGGVPRYRPLILLGLIFSLGGDVFLMRAEWFQLGLASFLIAHLFYIGAFSLGVGWRGSDLLIAVPFAGYGVASFLAMRDGMGADFGPALVYTAVITTMGWRAIVRCVRRGGDLSGVVAMIGAVVFISSDSMLAWARFVGTFPLHRVGIMSTYYTAQILIAYSVPLAIQPARATESAAPASAPDTSTVPAE